MPGRARRLLLLVCSIVLLLPALARAQEEAKGTIQIVDAKATKYAWIPNGPGQVFDKNHPPERSAFLVVDVPTNVTFADDGYVNGDVYIESAKGNKRGAIRSFDFDGELSYAPTVREYSLPMAGKKAAMPFSFIFVIPESAVDATIVLGAARATIKFPEPAAEFPAIGRGPMRVEVASTKFVSQAPPIVSEKPLSVARANGPPIEIPVVYDPPFERFVEAEVFARQRDPEASFPEQRYSYEKHDFSASFDDGSLLPARNFFYLSGQADADGRLATSKATLYFPVPSGATKGTIYFRREAIAEFEVAK
ncbi:MAG TPA: hypothetical protein VGN57_16985 [Pirellulaceae bacterium]|jgi:hypothetical protein|nr:hypothetical protein [Pirellulaceae bacterium]